MPLAKLTTPLCGVSLIFLIILIGACSEDEIGSGGNNPPGSQDCLNIESTYSGNVKPIIDAACAISGCHVTGGNGSGNFETYQGLKSKVDSGALLNRAVSRGDMPPSDTSGPEELTDTQKLAIRCWIEAGASNN